MTVVGVIIGVVTILFWLLLQPKKGFREARLVTTADTVANSNSCRGCSGWELLARML